MKKNLMTGGLGGKALREKIKYFQAWKKFCVIKYVSLLKNYPYLESLLKLFLIFQKFSRE